MRYRGSPNWKKYFHKDRYTKLMCHGRCPHCRGWKGSTKKEPGFKKKEYREIQEHINSALMSSNLD